MTSWVDLVCCSADNKRKADDPLRVPRKALVAGETCPICMCDMTVDEVLSWCKYSCGKSVHNKLKRLRLVKMDERRRRKLLQGVLLKT